MLPNTNLNQLKNEVSGLVSRNRLQEALDIINKEAKQYPVVSENITLLKARL